LDALVLPGNSSFDASACQHSDGVAVNPSRRPFSHSGLERVTKWRNRMVGASQKIPKQPASHLGLNVLDCVLDQEFAF